jgi:carbon-monoxide dehydrogenase medium subunit
MAGGQSLVPLLAMRLAAPSTLVDLNRLAGLAGFERRAAGRLRVGAMTRHRDLERAGTGLLAAAASHIGHGAIRARGTIGGSLAHADPNAELPAVALVTDASVAVAGPRGGRTIGAADLFEGMLQTSLADDEILTAVELAEPRRWGFAELARRHGDFALVLAAVTELASGWRVVVGGTGPVPERCAEAEVLLDRSGEGAAGAAAGQLVDEVAEAVAAAVEPYDDVHATAGYRRAMAGNLAGRATAQALRSVAGGGGEAR